MEAVTRARTLSLPRNVSERAEPLAALARRCYPDMAVCVEEDTTGWLIRIAPVGELTQTHDSGIAAALAAAGISFDGMMGWHILVNAGPLVWLESMYHSWALLAWSHWWRAHGDVRPWLVRVAPNDDLGVPALLSCDTASALLATMEDVTVELGDQTSVRRAIESGLIGVGSYIVPWLRARPGDMVHLAPGGPADAGSVSRFGIDAETPDAASRLMMRERADGPCTYRRTGNPATLADGWRAGQPVLLDIDLGYFDLVPKRRREPLARSCAIDELVDGLRPLAGWVSGVTIAYAPGSCPAERWAPLSSGLRAALMALFDSVLTVEKAAK
jgi:hypothetical protein